MLSLKSSVTPSSLSSTFREQDESGKDIGGWLIFSLNSSEDRSIYISALSASWAVWESQLEGNLYFFFFECLRWAVLLNHCFSRFWVIVFYLGYLCGNQDRKELFLMFCSRSLIVFSFIFWTMHLIFCIWH